MFSIDDEGWVTNPVRLQISNRTEEVTALSVVGVHPRDLRVVQPEADSVTTAEGKSTQHILLQLPRTYFKEDFGLRNIEFKVRNKNGTEVFLKFRMVGPAH